MEAPTVRILGDIDINSALGSRWESLVQSNIASGFMQSLNWAEVKRRQGLETVHFGIFNAGELIGGALCFTPARRNGAGILIAPEGPVLPWSDDKQSRLMLAALLSEASNFAEQSGIMSMRIEPRLPSPQPSILREFGRAPADLVPRETLYIDLSVSEEELLAQMSPKGRYNIKLASRHQVMVTQHTDLSAFESFYSAMTESSERDGFGLEPPEFFLNLLTTLLPTGHASIFFAEHENDLLGVLLLITYGQRATYLYGGITNTKRNLMGGYALQWEAIKHARNNGCNKYDFYGYVPHRSPEHEYSQFSLFKSRFGGQPVRFIGGHDYFFLPNLTKAIIKAAQEVAMQCV